VLATVVHPCSPAHIIPPELIREVGNLVLNTIKILQKGSKECDKFAETRWGIQMMEGGRDKV